jgi:hypothetical protein
MERARELLFPCAGLAQQQNVRLRPRVSLEP